jgi:hypothetical protein
MIYKDLQKERNHGFFPRKGVLNPFLGIVSNIKRVS